MLANRGFIASGTRKGSLSFYKSSFKEKLPWVVHIFLSWQLQLTLTKTVHGNLDFLMTTNSLKCHYFAWTGDVVCLNCHWVFKGITKIPNICDVEDDDDRKNWDIFAAKKLCKRGWALVTPDLIICFFHELVQPPSPISTSPSLVQWELYVFTTMPINILLTLVGYYIIYMYVCVAWECLLFFGNLIAKQIWCILIMYTFSIKYTSWRKRSKL